MNMFKRIGLFVLTNLAVVVLFGAILFLLENLLGINLGNGYGGLLAFSAIFGFLGALVSLFMSKFIAKMSYGIKPYTREDLGLLSGKKRLVYDVVSEISERNHIKMPEVGVYESAEPNAFATGATKNSSLVAVSSGLLDLMSEREIEAVVAHEMAHILNGDMVTMTLLQGVMNTFVIFFARIAAQLFDNATDGKFGAIGHFAAIILFEIVFGLLASIVVMAYSRRREFRADEGSAAFVGKEKMIAALEALKKYQNLAKGERTALTALQISSPSDSGIKRFFLSHPPLDERINNLENYRVHI